MNLAICGAQTYHMLLQDPKLLFCFKAKVIKTLILKYSVGANPKAW